MNDLGSGSDSQHTGLKNTLKLTGGVYAKRFVTAEFDREATTGVRSYVVDALFHHGRACTVAGRSKAPATTSPVTDLSVVISKSF